MSGGYFDYKQFELQQIADNIEQIVLENADQDWDCRYKHETIEKFNKAINLLREAYVYVQRIDWLISGDDSENTFHNRLKEQLERTTG